MSYAIALLLSLAFEMPIMNIDKIMFGSRERPNHTKIDSKRNTNFHKNNDVVNQNKEKKGNKNDQSPKNFNNKKRNLSIDSPLKHTKDVAMNLLEKS